MKLIIIVCKSIDNVVKFQKIKNFDECKNPLCPFEMILAFLNIDNILIVILAKNPKSPINLIIFYFILY